MSNGWPMMPLGEVLRPISRPEPVVAEKEYRLLGAHWYATGLYVKEVKSGSEIRADRLYRVEDGDFVYNRLFAWKGSFALANGNDNGCYVSNEFPCFAIDRTRLDGQYLWRYSSRQPAWTEALGLSSGGTPTSRNRLKEANLLAMRIPLPPLSEQRRIVARIEELAAKIEEASTCQRQATAEAGVLSGSAMTARFGPGQDVPRHPIADVADVRGGIQKGPHRLPNSHPVRYLTVAHVQRNSISVSDPRFFEVTPDELPRWMLKSGDVLIIEGNGSADQIGRTALFRGEIEVCVHQNHVIRIRPDRTKIMPEFLNAYLNSPLGQTEVQERSRTTSGLRSLSVGRIKQIEIPLPPISEQQRMVAYQDEVSEQSSRLTQLQSQTAAELNALLPSILDKAFKGEL